ncbi:YhgE/Pip domain-containing protein [Clostridium sp. HBUAS56017]|uniref:YhgE/Pip domain-containing protein n=1 Tax=Clostridium sp. HBUAS56017 TaxID=2571128 RepID=UPI0011779C7A|nr:YhgE/Pip domain-containing protein [Clostridium sp. HBUAS56017]
MNFLKIAGSDIKGIFKNRFIRVSVIAIIIVPLLYSLLYLDAFWDPYGRLKDMPVAVVNLDHGANLDGKFENYGNDFVDKLKDDNRVGWKFVSDEDASNGLEGNKYYAKLVITENFSKDIISAKEGAPKQADLRFVCNEKKNFLASQVNSKVESALKEEITKTVTETYVSGAFDNLYKVKDGMDAAADGSGQLNDGLNTANDGSSKLNDGQVQLNDGISQLNGKVPELVDGANKLNDGSNQLYDGQVQLNDGITKLNGKVPELVDGAKRLSDGSNQLYDGQIQLNDGLTKLNSQAPDLTSGVIRLNGGIKQIYSGYTTLIYPGVSGLDTGLKSMQAMLDKDSQYMTELNKGSDKVNAFGTKIVENSTNIKNGYDQVKSGVDKLIDGSTTSAQALKLAEQYLNQGKTNEALAIIKNVNAANDASAASVAKLKQGVSNFATGIDTYNAGVSQYTSGVNTLIGGYNKFITGINSGVGRLSEGSGALKVGLDNKFTPGLQEEYAGLAKLHASVTGTDGNPENLGLNMSASKLYAGSNRLVKGQGDLKGGIDTLNGKVPELRDGVPKLYDGSNKLVSGQGALKDGISTLSGKVPELKNGVNKLYDGSNKLVSGQSDLKDGITKLHDGSNELATKLKDGSGELNDGLKNTSEDMGTFVATPVNLEVAPINPVPNYGTGFAPYFANLSLWIGAIMMFFVISAKTEQYEGASKFDKAFGKFLSFGFVGVLQAVLVGVVIMALGLAPGNIGLYFGSLIFFSLVYIAIVQCLISLFGDAGRLLSIVLLIMQLTACAGTFPLELVPKFFVVLNPFMPFTYSVEALREISSATVINYGVVGKDFLILAIVLIVFLATSIAGATFGEKMQRVIEGRKEGNN